MTTRIPWPDQDARRYQLSDFAGDGPGLRAKIASLMAYDARLREVGLPPMSWWWVEQGGPMTSSRRYGPETEGCLSEPLVSAVDVASLFTWDMVDLLRSTQLMTKLSPVGDTLPEWMGKLGELADVIEVLLPPRGGG